MGEVDVGADDGAEARAADDRPHDGLVELQLVDGPAAEALQGGVARAEVVQGELHARLGQLREEPGARGRRAGFLAYLTGFRRPFR